MTTRLACTAARPLSRPRLPVRCGNNFVASSATRWLSTAVPNAELATGSSMIHQAFARRLRDSFRIAADSSVLSGLATRSRTVPRQSEFFYSNSTTHASTSAVSPLESLVCRFSSTHSPFAIRNSYYSRTRITSSKSRLGGSGSGQGGGLGPWSRFKALMNALPTNVMVWTIIGLNGLVFLSWQYAESSFREFRDPRKLQWMYANFTSSWDNLKSGRVWTLVTSSFSHSSSSHILMNLLTFYFFAPMGASILGNVPFLGLYLGGAVASSAISILWNQFMRKDGRPMPSHGASGGINAVLSFFACAFPTATVYVFFIVPLPAWAAIGGLIGWDFYSAVIQRRGSIVDSAGHLGGALGGALFFLRWRMGRLI